MKAFFTQLILIYCLLVGANLMGQDSWQIYKSPDGSFQVSCPGGLLQVKEQSTITGVGKLTNRAYYINMDKDHPNFLYMITSVHYPSGTFNQDSLELIGDFLKSTSLSLQESTGCRIQYELVNLEDEYPNMIMRLHDDESRTGIKAKIYIKNNVLYTLQAYTTSDNKLNDFLDKFINSFQLL